MALPATIAPMRAVLGDLPPDDGAWGCEVKWDGVRALGFLSGGQLRLQSSNLKDITLRYPELAPLAAALDGHDVILDGEVVTFNEEGRPDFGLLQNRMHLTGARAVADWAARQPVVWVLFDLLHLDGHDLYVPEGATPGPSALGWADRRRLLEGLVASGPNWQVPAVHTGDAAGLLDAVRAQGLGGVVAKRLDSPHEAGPRSPPPRKNKGRPHPEGGVGGGEGGGGNPARRPRPAPRGVPT